MLGDTVHVSGSPVPVADNGDSEAIDAEAFDGSNGGGGPGYDGGECGVVMYRRRSGEVGT